MEYNTELIILRNTTNRVLISKSLEETLVYIGKLSGPFKFNMESTMVKCATVLETSLQQKTFSRAH